jgi:SOCS box
MIVCVCVCVFVGITPLEYVCFKGFRQERRPQLSAFLIAYGASFQNIKNLHGHSLLQQELSRNTDDRIILRAVVKTLVHLPSLQSLGINVDLVHKMFPPSGVPERSFADGQRSEVSLRCYWYQNLSSSPRSLQHHCRVSVRNSLGPKRLRYVSTLPLPVTLQDYLLLEFDEYR